MKATIDVPDVLYRRVKARAALQGRPVREVTIELYESWLAEAEGDQTASVAAMDGWLARWQELGDETARRAVDPRTTREILLQDRR